MCLRLLAESFWLKHVEIVFLRTGMKNWLHMWILWRLNDNIVICFTHVTSSNNEIAMYSLKDNVYSHKLQLYGNLFPPAAASANGRAEIAFLFLVSFLYEITQLW